jgi:hypothetical protein
LLAEIYMYNHSEFLGGVDPAINPGTFHAVIANWIGRGSHPVAVDTALGREVFNYPIYAYATSSARRPGNAVEVKMNMAYTLSTKREFDRAQHLHRVKYFHYLLQLDEQGRITGGSYFSDSDRVDMLWVPLHAAASGQEGNEKGNPHVDVAEVLSMWRESVPEEIRNKWLNIDPLPEDAIRGRRRRSGGRGTGRRNGRGHAERSERRNRRLVAQAANKKGVSCETPVCVNPFLRADNYSRGRTAPVSPL